jgi:hypothetical protein
MEISITELANILLEKRHQPSDFYYPVGTKLVIRTVTMIITGKLKAVYPTELILSDACWIAETDRYADFLSNGKIKEAEPFPGDAGVGRGAIIDFAEWVSELPRKQI